jgi:hypothetical protein
VFMEQALADLVREHKSETDPERKRQITKAATQLELEIAEYPLAPDGAYLRWLETLGDLRGNRNG